MPEKRDDPGRPRIGLGFNLSGATEGQLRVHAMMASGPRGDVPLPFMAMMDRPDLVIAIQEVGAAIRFRGILADGDRELAILATAGAIECAYEWDYHEPLARRAGVNPAAIAATRGCAAENIDERDATIIAVCRSLSRDRRIADEALNAAIAQLGRESVTELIAISGYYSLLALFIFAGSECIAMPAADDPPTEA